MALWSSNSVKHFMADVMIRQIVIKNIIVNTMACYCEITTAKQFKVCG
jgi:hypothetical protein